MSFNEPVVGVDFSRKTLEQVLIGVGPAIDLTRYP
jgi:hypothetical protein